jgi:hypothetical protein
MAASKIFNIYPDRPGELKQNCKINAGTLTSANGKIFLGSERTHSFASDVEVGDLVVAYETDSDGDLVVAGRAYTDLQPIGEIVSEPRLVGVEPAVGEHTYGNYEYRADVLFYGQRIRTRTVYVAQSNNISANQFLKAAAQSGYENELEESGTQTGYVILDGLTASSSAVSHQSAPVLEGFEVQTSDLS